MAEFLFGVLLGVVAFILLLYTFIKIALWEDDE